MHNSIYVRELARAFEKKAACIIMERDIMTAITMIKALGATKQSKFIEIRHQYIKEKIKNHYITLKHSPP